MSDMAGYAATVAVEPSGSERDTMERMGRATRLRQGYGVPSIEGKVAREAMSEWSRGDASDIDGETERSICAGAHESISKQAIEISRHDPSNPEIQGSNVVGASKTWRIPYWRQVVSYRANHFQSRTLHLS
jgi:hypothetical protein